MFDPTIYENIKVVIEGAVYDLDLSGMIAVTDRSDRIDLSTMSRYYSIQFKLPEGTVSAELRLYAGISDLAAEILNLEHESYGCKLAVCYISEMTEIDEACQRIEIAMKHIWGIHIPIEQEISFSFHVPPRKYTNRILVRFDRTVTENQIEDIPNLMEHVLKSLQALERIQR